jgi:CRISPR-associated endoribonuclease Cas6
VPTIIELSLKAERPVRADTRQLHGLACALFESEESAHLGQEKPFTVWPLLHGAQDSDLEWTLRAAWLPDGPPPAAAACDVLRLGSVTCAVTESVHRSVTHARLAARQTFLTAALVFRSPAYFAQNGTDTLTPDPRLILGSYRRHWNASVPGGEVMAVSDDSFREVHRATRLTAFELRTEDMDSGRGHLRTGFTGSASLQLDRTASAEAQSVFSTLARFAEFCGTGAQTTHGFGATSLAAVAGES